MVETDSSNGGDTVRRLPTESRLLSFYDRLRERAVAAVERRGGRWGEKTAASLLLVPDVFILVVRLTLDRDVPTDTRRTLGGALIYFLAPLDLLPEVLLGPTGYLEDLVLACVVLARALGPDLETYAERHWSGDGQLREVLAQITRSAEALLGEGLSSRVTRLLARRGFDV